MKIKTILIRIGLLVACIAVTACVSQTDMAGLHTTSKSLEGYGTHGDGQRPIDVSMARLLASPWSLNGKAITTTGVLAVEPEGTALYLNGESYHLKITDNAVGLRPLGTSGTNWEDLNGMYVIVTGRYKHGPFSRWPNGLIVDIEPINPPTIVLPDFAVTHAIVELSESENDHLGTVLQTFAAKGGFHCEASTFSRHGRKMQSYSLLRRDVTVGIMSSSELNTFMIRIYAMTVTSKWAAVRDDLTQYLKKEFGDNIEVNWKKGDAQTPRRE